MFVGFFQQYQVKRSKKSKVFHYAYKVKCVWKAVNTHFCNGSSKGQNVKSQVIIDWGQSTTRAIRTWTVSLRQKSSVKLTHKGIIIQTRATYHGYSYLTDIWNKFSYNNFTVISPQVHFEEGFTLNHVSLLVQSKYI